MKLTKDMLLQYLVDVLGHDRQEAKHEVKVYRMAELLTVDQLEECYKFNNLTI